MSAGILIGCAGSEPGGSSGAAGSSGTPGSAGASGSAGAGGSAGTTGSGGSGTGGTTGVGGTSGEAGTAGAAGTTGGTGGGTPGTGGSNAGAGGSTGRGGAGGTGGAAGRGGTGGGSAGTGGAAGTTGTGGSGTSTLPFSYYIGADVTDQETQSTTTRATLLSIMQSHGFNYIRLRTFVDPKASDGYDKNNGYDDIAHTASFGKQVKDAGMGLLLDFHYSDNWADPGKQCVPVAWQTYTTIADLATAVHDYTKASIQTMIAGGARPDMVQIGNEITPGMLIHRCDSGGQPISGMNNPVTGSISNWTNLGMLLKAGVAGVKEVDSGIVIAMHLDRGNDLTSSRNFINNATTQGVQFDVFGESCYTAYQGQPSAWMNTFTMLASMFPNMKFMIAEYGPEQKAANDMIFNLPSNRGVGTFNWEPTTQGAWNTGHDLLRRSGTSYTAQPDMALYDQMKIDYASRL
ncbi:MAG TPA: glycosyl hydrolase 53 family protein [Polyangia bacterium]|nr:glycosyl hydrolase 53 family protein [Polyangia bacterium]